MQIKLFLLAGFISLATPTVVQANALVTSDLGDRSSVELVVYNNNLGLVIETRNIDLAQGEGELRFSQVPALIDPQTVHIRSVSTPEGFEILEQNYEHDLVNSATLLNKYVGEKIKIIDWNKYQDRKEEVEATLLSTNGPVYQIGDEIYIGHPGVKVLPKLPEDLVLEPTLVWKYHTKATETQTLEVTYLVQSISWDADYLLVMDEKSGNAELSAWVTLTNASGGAYENASLKLIAGSVNRVTPARPKAMMMRAASAMEFDAAPMGRGFSQSSSFEYHRYDLGRLTDLKNNETKQIHFMTANGVPVTKEYRVHGSQGYYNRQRGQTKLPVLVYLQFQNDKKSELGNPLPAGTIRVYQEDEKGAKQFLGESNIDHTPKDEEIEVKVGDAFDLVAERKQTDYRKITKNLHESEWEVVLKNRKDEDVVIEVNENLQGNWKILKQSHPYEKDSAFSAVFRINVPKNSEVTLTYRVQVGI